jgi:hypothetical protein
MQGDGWVCNWLYRFFNMFCNAVGVRYFIEMVSCFTTIAFPVIKVNCYVADAYRL